MGFFVDLKHKDTAKVVNGAVKSLSGVRGECSFSILGDVVTFHWNPLCSDGPIKVCSVVLPTVSTNLDDTGSKFVPEGWIDVVPVGVAAMLSAMSGAAPRSPSP